MQTQPDLAPHFSVRAAQSLSRFLTWGMTGEQRRELLAETDADWEDMHSDRGPLQVLERAARGIPAAVWARMDDRDVTALPAAIAIAAFGAGGVAAGTIETTYPPAFRILVLITAIGTLQLGILLILQPRQIVTKRYRFAMVLLAIGFIGIAFNLPAAETWAYETPVVDYPLLDQTMGAGFAIAGIGFALFVAASFVGTQRRLFVAVGVLVMLGTAILGVTQIIWGLLAAPSDLAITLSSIAVGLASLSMVHVIPRLRHLEIT